MAFKKEEFIQGFVSETEEHLNSINDGIIKLKDSPEDKETLALVLRELHTIKGSSRMLGFSSIEKISHGLEDVFKGLRDGHYELTDLIIKLTFITSDCIKRMLLKIQKEGNDKINTEPFEETYEKACSGLFFSTENLELENLEKKSTDNENSLSLDENENLENITSIRINIERINEIIRSFDNLIIRQFRFKHQFEAFEKKIHEVPKQLKEDIALTENAIFDIQHQILNLRMLPLDIVLTPIRKEIQEEALRMQKDIHLNIPQTDFMLDKVILEQLKDILLHLVRNAIDHGIESQEQRKLLKKDPKGNISIKAVQTSNYIKISVSDDGSGINYEKVREKPITKFPSNKKEILEMSEKELQQYLFISGFTTKDKATEISGRGVGLDVVRDSMEKIKGKIHLFSQKDQGTTFELTIPLSLATQQGLFITAGGIKFMIPSHYVKEIMDAESCAMTSMQGQLFVSLHNQLIPAYYLSSILGNNQIERDSSKTTVIIVEYLESLLAIIVDSIEKYENVVVNSLPPVLKKLDSVQGVVYDENYDIIPILNIPDTMQRLKSLLAYEIKKYKTKNEKRTFSILIVDDSVTTRQIEQTIFETAGYHVESAIDGIEALEKLKEIHIDAIITDISMPRMDGLTLLSNIRHLDEYSKTPVIIVSGAYDPEAKSMFLEAGAQAFIVKSEFQRGNLLQAVKEFLGE